MPRRNRVPGIGMELSSSQPTRRSRAMPARIERGDLGDERGRRSGRVHALQTTLPPATQGGRPRSALRMKTSPRYAAGRAPHRRPPTAELRGRWRAPTPANLLEHDAMHVVPMRPFRSAVRTGDGGHVRACTGECRAKRLPRTGESGRAAGSARPTRPASTPGECRSVHRFALDPDIARAVGRTRPSAPDQTRSPTTTSATPSATSSGPGEPASRSFDQP